MNVRAAEEADIERLATLWHDGWRDAHAQIVPAVLTRLRTRESFRQRMHAHLADVRVIGPADAPAGFFMLKGDELYQFYVAAPARGSLVASILMADAEARLRERGVGTAWLACAIGNNRAARFYEKCGWRRVATVTINTLDDSTGTLPLDVWRYEKSLGS